MKIANPTLQNSQINQMFKAQSPPSNHNPM